MAIYFNPYSSKAPLILDSFGDNWPQEPIHRKHGFPLYHWLLTESGKGSIEIENKSFTLNKGESILISPHIPHIYTKCSQQWTTAFATFDGSIASQIPAIVGPSPYLFAPSNHRSYFEKWIKQIVVRHKQNHLTAMSLSNDCYDFLLHFSEISNSLNSENHPLFMHYVFPVITQIEKYYYSALTLEELAESIYISPQYLNRLFKRFVNQTVYSYLMNYRVYKAKELLTGQPDLTVQDIASQVGFINVSHFIATFKKNTGYTPLQFKKYMVLQNTIADP